MFGVSRAAAAGLLFCLTAMTAGSASLADDGKRLLLTGSSTVAPIANEIARLYESAHPDVRIDVQTGGSTRGIIDLRRGLSDIAMVSRKLTPSEQEDLTAHTFALDGLAVIVHADNPVDSLSREDIRLIYTRAATDWAEFGGTPGEIVVINKAEGRATLDLFLDHFGLIPPEIKPHMVIGENEQGIKAVANNPQAIAYVAVSTAFYDAEHGVPIKLVALDGVPAKVETVADSRYPAIRQLNLVTRGEVDPLGRSFLRLTRSDKVHGILDSFHVVAPSN